jgi:hypothetical protein
MPTPTPGTGAAVGGWQGEGRRARDLLLCQCGRGAVPVRKGGCASAEGGSVPVRKVGCASAERGSVPVRKGGCASAERGSKPVRKGEL